MNHKKEPRLCSVKGLTGCIFLGFFEEDEPILQVNAFMKPKDELRLRRDFYVSGIVPNFMRIDVLHKVFAIVEMPDGTVKKASPEDIVFLDREGGRRHGRKNNITLGAGTLYFLDQNGKTLKANGIPVHEVGYTEDPEEADLLGCPPIQLIQSKREATFTATIPGNYRLRLLRIFDPVYAQHWRSKAHVRRWNIRRKKL